jgi:hypothetical protein
MIAPRKTPRLPSSRAASQGLHLPSAAGVGVRPTPRSSTSTTQPRALQIRINKSDPGLTGEGWLLREVKAKTWEKKTCSMLIARSSANRTTSSGLS